eukprot:m.12678 g.12678  ORF g.12678 m.12678 type:complete len:277 (-) comp6054_c0_seq1:29-859(-)
MAAKKIIDPFGHAGQALGYAAFRPTYPRSLLESIAAAVGPKRDLAVDVATGTGQVAVPLAADPPEGLGFASVVAFDQSSEQLKHARPHPRVRYTQGDAYAMPAETHSVDLVTVAQAAHWFDMPRFLSEVTRVLRPGGLLAVAGYGVCTLGRPAQQAVFTDYYRRLGSHLLPGQAGCYWDCDRPRLDSGMADVTFSPPLQAEPTREWHRDSRSLHRTVFEGYLRTWSAYRAYCVAHPDHPDLVTSVLAQLDAAAAGSPDPDMWPVTFPYFLLLGRSK